MNSQKRRVGFMVASLEPGGIETYLLRFLRHVGDRIEPIVICKSGHTGRLLPAYEALGVRVLPMKTGYLHPMAWRRFTSFLRREQIETICDFSGNFAGVYMLLARLAGVPTRITFYRASTNHFPETKFRLAYNALVNKLVYRHATAILSNSATALAFFFPYRKAEDGRFQVIYNGVAQADISCAEGRNAVREELGITSANFVVGHVGRYNVAKNHETILKVASLVCHQNPQVRFLLCGRDTDGPELAARVKALDLREQVLTLGHRFDVSRILHAMDLFYFPSITEGQPNALIEAMLSGLPVLASSIDPILEVVPPTMEALLIDPYDGEGAASKIRELMVCPQKQEAYKAYRWAAKQFDAEANFSSFEHEL